MQGHLLRVALLFAYLVALGVILSRQARANLLWVVASVAADADQYACVVVQLAEHLPLGASHAAILANSLCQGCGLPARIVSTHAASRSTL